jgi:hypothetical protein
MKKIKINFTDFWGGFNPTDNYFYNLLIQEFDVEISNNPDYLFFSIFGNNHQYYKCKKIFYTGENVAPPLGYADYSFSFDYMDDKRNYRLPHYLLYDGYYELTNKKIDASLANRKFCSFVVSNGGCDVRNNFFQKLFKYKKVDSGGKFANNIGYAVDNKRLFQSEYKFAITFENNAYRPDYEWYITEKAFEAMCVNSIPIYRGGNKISEDFNSKSFINYHDFKSEDDMIEYIIYLDKNDDKYIEVLKEPWFINNQVPDNNKIENIKKFLYGIFEKRDN